MGDDKTRIYMPRIQYTTHEPCVAHGLATESCIFTIRAMYMYYAIFIQQQIETTLYMLYIRHNIGIVKADSASRTRLFPKSTN